MLAEVPNFILYLLTVPGGRGRGWCVGVGEVRRMYREMDDGVGVVREKGEGRSV